MNPAPAPKKFKLPPLVTYVIIGLLLAAVGLAFIMLLNRGQQVRLEGSILKVRTVSIDDNSSIAVVDLRLKNTSGALFQSKELTVTVTQADGSRVDGITMTEMDLDRVLDFYKTAGPRYNPTLKVRDRLRAGEQQDRTAAGSFALSEKALQDRRNLTVKIQDADGVVIEFAERAAK